MKCNETVTISLKSYELMKSEIEIYKSDMSKLNNDLLHVINKDRKYSIKVTTSTYLNRLEVDVYTDSDIVAGLYKDIESNKIQIESLETLLKTKDSEIEHLEYIKQTSILWGLIKFNKN